MCPAEGIMALHDPELRSLYDLKVPIARQVLGWPLTVTGVRAMWFGFDARPENPTGCEGTQKKRWGRYRAVCLLHWRNTVICNHHSRLDTFVMSSPHSIISFCQLLAMRTLWVYILFQLLWCPMVCRLFQDRTTLLLLTWYQPTFAVKWRNEQHTSENTWPLRQSNVACLTATRCPVT